MMQKDLLGQDIFLIGRPSPLRRKLALQYLELTQRELEFVSLSRDTTESDLKQRREISAATAFYIDQSAVRAASQGRILVLEGIEKVCDLTFLYGQYLGSLLEETLVEGWLNVETRVEIQVRREQQKLGNLIK